MCIWHEVRNFASQKFRYGNPTTVQYNQGRATATLEIASLPLSLFTENDRGATPPVTEQK